MQFNINQNMLVRSMSCGLSLTMLLFSVVASKGQLSSSIINSKSTDLESTFNSLTSIDISNTLDIINDNAVGSEASIETYLMYVDKYSVRYRSLPIISDSTALGVLNKGDEVDVISQTDEWCKCIVDDNIVYIHSEMLSEEVTPDEIEIMNEIAGIISIEESEVPLTSDSGRIKGPSGEETYYNLNMSNVISRMKSLGYDYEYWIREDGVKMYGEYVLVSANFDIRPIGTVIETSLGLGIVADTGDFVKYNPTGIDIATTW